MGWSGMGTGRMGHPKLFTAVIPQILSTQPRGTNCCVPNPTTQHRHSQPPCNVARWHPSLGMLTPPSGSHK